MLISWMVSGPGSLGESQAAEPVAVSGSGGAVAAQQRMFPADRVIEVRVELPAENWDQLRRETRSLFQALARERPAEGPFSYQPAHLVWDGVDVSSVELRKKGFLGSLDEVRPSLRIKLPKEGRHPHFGPYTRLAIHNNKQDTAGLSQYLTYWMFRRAGLAAPLSGFVKLTVNGKYLGVYSHVETIEAPMLDRCFGDSKGSLFEGTVVDFFPDQIANFEAKTKDVQRETLRQVAELMAADTLDLEGLRKLVDIDAFVKFWAMESLLGFWDGYTHNQNNFFVYQNTQNNLLYMIPWGTDAAWSKTVPPMIEAVKHRSVHSNAMLANRLYALPEVRELYRQTLVQLMADVWHEDEILAEATRVSAMLKGLRHDEESEKAALQSEELIRKFIRDRRQAIERDLQKWPVRITTGPRRPAYVKQLAEGKAKFDTQWFTQSPSRPDEQGHTELELNWNNEPVKFRQVGAYAEPSKDPSLPKVDGAPPPTLVLVGVRESDGKRLTIAVGTDHAKFTAGTEPVGVFGVMFEGSPLFFLAQAMFQGDSLKFVDGLATFEEAAMKEGAPVKGDLSFRVVQFGGGKPVKLSAAAPEKSDAPAAAGSAE